MVTYKEKEKLEYDKQQTKFNDVGLMINNPLKCAIKTDNTNYETVVMCPFCLDTIKLWKFPLKNGLRVCPTCTNKMMLSTLVKKMDLAEFTRWVYDYHLNGFWSKVFPDFKGWNEKLYSLGMSKEFWEEYKKLRGDSKEDE